MRRALIVIISMLVIGRLLSGTDNVQARPTESAASEIFLPVSITEISHNTLLIADYRNIYLFKRGYLQKVNIKLPPGLKFVPTDTAVSGTTVFVANYTGNDILVGKFINDTSTLEILHDIRDTNTKSPEGIAVFGNYVAIADYDGNNVEIFRQSSINGEPAVCDLPLRQAHGIAFADGKLFVTSLNDRTVDKIDPGACSIIAKTGGEGWGRGQYLWPTSVANAGNGRIVVSDAHTGRLTLLRTDNLSVIDTWGGNGPGRFNMPYGVEAASGEIWVASAFNQTIFEVKKLSWDALRRYPVDPRAWIWHQGLFPENTEINEHNYSIYTGREKVMIGQECYQPSYAELIPCTAGGPKLDITALGSGEFYFLQGISLSCGTIISSPQNQIALFYENGSRDAKKIRIGWDVWKIGNQLVGPLGPVKFPDMCLSQDEKGGTKTVND